MIYVIFIDMFGKTSSRPILWPKFEKTKSRQFWIIKWQVRFILIILVACRYDEDNEIGGEIEVIIEYYFHCTRSIFKMIDFFLNDSNNADNGQRKVIFSYKYR